MVHGAKHARCMPQGHNKSLPLGKDWSQLRDCHWVASKVMQLFSIALILASQCLRLHCIHLSELPHHIDLQMQQQLLQLLERICLEQYYDSILIYGRAPCVFHTVLQQLKLPTVLFSKGSSRKDWNFNSQPLVLSCGATTEQEENTHTMLKLQNARRLVYLEAHIQPHWVCEDYNEREQHNVAMLDSQFATSGMFYSCRCFHQEKHIQLMLQESSLIYVEQFRNMHGAIIRSEADQLIPRANIYRDADGKIRMLGYVANLINLYVERVNATLHLRDNVEIGRTTYYGDIVEWTRQDLLDVAATLGTTMLAENFEILSYPYVISTYCFMVPLPAPLDYKKIYAIIVKPWAMGGFVLFFLIFSLLLIYSKNLSWRDLSLANILLNDRCLRGLLGHSFPLPDTSNRHLKAICCLICFISILTTTMYECYLQAFFTHPPLEPFLRSLAEIRDSPYKIAIDRREANALLKSRNLTTANGTNLYILDSWHEFARLRDTFNSSYVYMVTETRWQTYAEQQRYFDRPVYFYSKDFCLYEFIFLCVPLRRHLPYRHLFEEHMLIMQDFGMLDYWLGRSFYDMVLLGLTPLDDYSTPYIVEDAVYLRDITMILALYGAGHLLASICFVIECWRGRARRVVLPH